MNYDDFGREMPRNNRKDGQTSNNQGRTDKIRIDHFNSWN